MFSGSREFVRLTHASEFEELYLSHVRHYRLGGKTYCFRIGLGGVTNIANFCRLISSLLLVISMETNHDVTELVFIIDRSGSMSGLESDTIGGFNSVISKQKKEKGRTIVSTVLFSTELETVHDRVDIGEVKKMTKKQYCVGGCTALLDAVGITVDRIRRRQENDDEKVKTTLVVIITDGCENSSQEYTYANVKNLIDRQKENGWDFLFLGANIDVAKEAGRMGISMENSVEYCCDSEGVRGMYCTVDAKLSRARKKGSFSPDE